jgi:hypothetical protein
MKIIFKHSTLNIQSLAKVPFNSALDEHQPYNSFVFIKRFFKFFAMSIYLWLPQIQRNYAIMPSYLTSVATKFMHQPDSTGHYEAS